jgi:hypothetical protein
MGVAVDAWSLVFVNVCQYVHAPFVLMMYRRHRPLLSTSPLVRFLRPPVSTVFHGTWPFDFGSNCSCFALAVVAHRKALGTLNDKLLTDFIAYAGVDNINLSYSGYTISSYQS